VREQLISTAGSQGGRDLEIKIPVGVTFLSQTCFVPLKYIFSSFGATNDKV